MLEAKATVPDTSLVAFFRDHLERSQGRINGPEMAQILRGDPRLSAQELFSLGASNRVPLSISRALTREDDLPRRDPEAQVRRVIEGQRIQLSEPARCGNPVLPSHFYGGYSQTPDVSVVESGKARVFLHNFNKLAVTERGYIEALTRIESAWLWPFVRNAPCERLPGRTLLLVVEGSALFSHWLLDTLPRFYVAQLAGHSLQEFDQVLVASANAAFHRESLTLLGVDAGRIRRRSRQRAYFELDDLVSITAVREGFLGGAWLFDYVQSLFGAKPSMRPHSRVFISRSRASRRRVINEDALCAIASRYGFTVLHGENISIGDMARLMSEATHVIAPHGAGTANLSFAPPGTRVLELFGAHIASECWQICNVRGMHYSVLQGKAPDGSALTRERIAAMSFVEKNGMDYIVDVQAFRAALDLLTS